MKKLEDSLTEALKSNKRVQENLEKEKQLAANRYHTNTKLMEEMAEVKKDKAKAEAEHKSLQSLLDKKKAAESELESMVKDLKEKLGKFDGDKKSAMKMEKAKRDNVVTKLEQEKKEIQVRRSRPFDTF